MQEKCQSFADSPYSRKSVNVLFPGYIEGKPYTLTGNLVLLFVTLLSIVLDFTAVMLTVVSLLLIVNIALLESYLVQDAVDECWWREKVGELGSGQ